jgi:SAC3 family protein LENG8/THP3
MYQQYQQYAQPQQSHAQPVLSQPSRHLSRDSNSNNNSNNLTWNGTAWVSANPPSGSSAVSSFSTASSHHHYVPPQLSQTPSQYPAQQQSLMPSSSSAQSAVSLVQQYTQYYHAWTAQQQGHVAHARTYTPHSPDYQTAMQHAGTCQTYAEDSSRAAHYFHQNPQATIATAPLSLPPTPPTTATTAAATTTTTTSHALNNPPRVQQPHTIPQKTPTPAKAKPPMKDYVDRCLQQCRNETEKRAMVSEIERLMSGLIQKGTFHDMEWGNLQLIAVPERNSVPATPSLRPTHPYQGPTRNDVSYYGPTNVQAGHPSSAAGASPQSLRNPKKRRFSVQTPSVTVDPTINYYGPSITHNSTHSFSSSQQQQTSKSRQKDGFNQSSLALDVRARRFSGPGGIDDIQQTTTQAISGFDRFMGKAAIGGSTKPLDEEDYEAMTVKGTCHVLEKSYLRLTAPPRAELVRPEQVLRKHVAQLKTERQKPAATRRDYLWFCSQLKAVRQDCTVQRIQNAFTVDVYETHARIALEEGDLNEYNQCQTQLKYLYDLLRNDSDEYLAAQQYEDEFLAYRVLYYVFLTGNQSYQGGSSDLLHLLLQLSGPDRSSHPSIAHALKVRAACAQTDYHDFFRLRETCPNHGKYLMDRMVPSMRFKALQRICQAYRPSVETGFALKELGFEKNATIGKQWLKSCGCVLDDDESIIDTKESIVRESDLEHKQSLI